MSDDKRLFKKGDKVTLTVEVRAAQKPNQATLLTRLVGSGVSIWLSPSSLSFGTLTPVPEPAYVPEVGDLFQFVSKNGSPPSWDGHYACRCLFVDDDRIVWERLVSGSLAQHDLRQGGFIYKEVW